MTQSNKQSVPDPVSVQTMFLLYKVELFYRKGLLPKAAFQIEGTSQEIGCIKKGKKGKIGRSTTGMKD